MSEREDRLELLRRDANEQFRDLEKISEPQVYGVGVLLGPSLARWAISEIDYLRECVTHYREENSRLRDYRQNASGDYNKDDVIVKLQNELYIQGREVDHLREQVQQLTSEPYVVRISRREFMELPIETRRRVIERDVDNNFNIIEYLKYVTEGEE